MICFQPKPLFAEDWRMDDMTEWPVNAIKGCYHGIIFWQHDPLDSKHIEPNHSSRLAMVSSSSTRSVPVPQRWHPKVMKNPMMMPLLTTAIRRSCMGNVVDFFPLIVSYSLFLPLYVVSRSIVSSASMWMPWFPEAPSFLILQWILNLIPEQLMLEVLLENVWTSSILKTLLGC